MRKIRCLGASLAAISLSAVPRAASAQLATPQPPVQRALQRTSAGAVLPSDEQQTLAAIADKLDWDAQTRGVLMIVSPEDTYLGAPQSGSSEDTAGTLPTQGFKPDSAGEFPIAEVASSFDRRLVGVGTLSVLAPRSMTVLNYERLPKADPLAGMSMAVKLRLLESSFTADQWTAAGSDNGIGVAELDRKQSVIFLSMLPDPFVVESATAVGARASADSSTTLTADQRASTRLRLQKRLDWNYVRGDKGNIGLGSNNVSEDSSYKYRLPYVMPRIFLPPANGESLPLTDTYGVALTSVTSNHAKPSQLPSNWAALDVPVALTPSITVGELVAMVARITGTQLRCDPRYAKRTITFIGDSARAEDVLKALCWAITGTWRRVGDVFVLTDDLVGLGIRHVKIDDWYEENSLYALLYTEKSREGLAAKEYQALGWAEADPFKPDAALIGELDAFSAKPPLAFPGSGITTETPVIPIADLPKLLQDRVRDRLVERQSDRSRMANIGIESAPFRTDVIAMGVQVEPSFYVEGLGSISTFGAFQKDAYSDILAKPYVMPDYAPKKPNESEIAFDSSVSPRAMLIDPREPQNIAKLAEEARRRGLNQLWVLVHDGDNAKIATAISEGKRNGLAVHAVVRLLRVGATEAGAALDCNLLGESMTEYVRRRRLQAQQIRATVGPFDATSWRISSVNLSRWLRDEVTNLLLERGDFRQTTASEAIAITTEMARLAATPGLSGIVIQDKGAPGSEAAPKNNETPYYSMFSPDFEIQMGYTVGNRIECLKALGFDPIDLSPLPRGDEALRIGLPFFPDPGGLSQQSVVNRSASGKSLWRAWSDFRHDGSEAVLADVIKGIRTQRPDLPIMISQFDDPTNNHYNWYGSFEKPDVVVKARQIPDRVIGSGVLHSVDLPGIAREQSRVAFSTMSLGGPSNFQGEGIRSDVLARLAQVANDAKKWDGIVLDFSNASPAETLDILHLLPLMNEGK